LTFGCFALRRIAPLAAFLAGAAALASGAALLSAAEQPTSATLGTALAEVATVSPLPSPRIEKARELAARVRIYRDSFGMPHIDGDNDESVAFGFAYAQAEDYFWQVEDNYILCLGRYSEVYGPKGLNSDLLNRAFEIVPRSKASYARLEPKLKRFCEAFAGGLNWYLASHPEVKPRLITRFEPWHILAYGRQMLLELTYRYTRLSNNYMPRSNDLIWMAGSNGWAVAPRRTSSGHAMLMVNPHLPLFGFAQLYEAHLRSGEGWSFIGATTYGNPVLSMGHNENLGWALTTNEPDIADVWRVKFDDPRDKLNYRYGSGYRRATQWTETLGVKTGEDVTQRTVQLRRTHHGPIVTREDDTHYLAARVAGVEDALMLAQSLKLVRARSLAEFRRGLDMQKFPLMNLIYADRTGNIYFLYNGLVPRRNPALDWSKPVDGGDPKNDWTGFHAVSELPQVLNPPSGYVQNCNSSPFTTCRVGSPKAEDFPPYMVEDRDDDKRRAQMARELLEGMSQVSFDEFQLTAFDTKVFWAWKELPKYKKRLKQLEATNPQLAQLVAPYLRHLLAWDCRIAAESTAATLCEAWYEELYGLTYPAEKLLDKYVRDPDAEFEALVRAAIKLSALHGTWQVPWSQLFRTQRPPYVAGFLDLPFDDKKMSLPSLAAPGPMGVIFTQYYSPSVRIPFLKLPEKRYGLIGTSYLAVYEFGERVRGASAVNFGASGDPESPHYFDQARLLADRKLKPELFYWTDVVAAARYSYHPGQESGAAETHAPAH